MSRTIKELSKETHLTRPTIEMRMNHIPNFREQHTSKSKNRVIIDDAGCKIISQMHGYKKGANGTNSDSKNYSKITVNLLKNLLQQERRQNKQLLGQLKDNHDDKNHLMDLLRRQQKLADQEQQLEMASATENKNLKGQIKRLKALPSSSDKSIDHIVNDAEKPKNRPHKSKPGFWSRLFGNY